MNRMRNKDSGLRWLSDHLGLSSAGLILLGLSSSYIALDPKVASLQTLSGVFGSGLPLAIASIAETVVLLIGGIDLSVGSVMSLVSVVVATHMGSSIESMVLWALIGIAIGGIVGFINATLIERLGISAFIATLATMEVVQGLALSVLSSPGGSVPSAFSNIFTGQSSIGIPYGGLAIVILLVLWVFAKYTKQVRWIYAVGSDRSAARLNGVRDGRTIFLAYISCGCLAGVAGLAFSALLNSGDPVEGGTYLLPAIAAAVIGGTSIFGGRGGAFGSAIGAFILTVLADVLFAAGVTPFYNALFTGAVTVVVVAIGVLADRFGRRQHLNAG
jgi:ribose transport system permease protein